MYVYTVGCGWHRDGDKFYVTREPWWTWLIQTIADLLCTATRHHWCNHKAMTWALFLSDDHSTRIEIPATRELTFEYCRWRGWPTWDTQDDETDETDQ